MAVALQKRAEPDAGDLPELVELEPRQELAPGPGRDHKKGPPREMRDGPLDARTV